MTKPIGVINSFLLFGSFISKVLLILLVVLGMTTLLDRINTIQYGELTFGLMIFWLIIGAIYEYKKLSTKGDE